MTGIYKYHRFHNNQHDYRNSYLRGDRSSSGRNTGWDYENDGQTSYDIEELATELYRMHDNDPEMKEALIYYMKEAVSLQEGGNRDIADITRITDAQLSELFDTNDDGHITRQEVGAAWRNNGYGLNRLQNYAGIEHDQHNRYNRTVLAQGLYDLYGNRFDYKMFQSHLNTLFGTGLNVTDEQLLELFEHPEYGQHYDFMQRNREDGPLPLKRNPLQQADRLAFQSQNSGYNYIMHQIFGFSNPRMQFHPNSLFFSPFGASFFGNGSPSIQLSKLF